MSVISEKAKYFINEKSATITLSRFCAIKNDCARGLKRYMARRREKDKEKTREIEKEKSGGSIPNIISIYVSWGG